MELSKSRVINQGLCCASCQEDVNVHGCAKCGDMFSEGEEIYCEHHSHSDCEHYCIGCKPKEGKDV